LDTVDGTPSRLSPLDLTDNSSASTRKEISDGINIPDRMDKSNGPLEAVTSLDTVDGMLSRVSLLRRILTFFGAEREEILSGMTTLDMEDRNNGLKDPDLKLVMEAGINSLIYGEDATDTFLPLSLMETSLGTDMNRLILDLIIGIILRELFADMEDGINSLRILRNYLDMGLLMLRICAMYC